MNKGIERKCFKCQDIFFICKKCWRGQRYCSLDCRQSSRKEKLKAYQKKYTRSLKGMTSNRVRQQRFRKNKKSVTYHSSIKKKYPLFFPPVKIKSTKRLCRCCHIRIDNIVSFKEAALIFSFHRWRSHSI